MLSSKEIIGIDLSGNQLKIAQMGFAPGKKEILNIATQDIRNLPEDDIARAIKDVLSGLQITKPRVIAAIPAFLAITKNIEIPSSDPQEIRDIINLQGSRHTPYSREEIIIDYINIGTYKQDYSKILLVIVTRSIIRRQLEILDKAGLFVERMAFAPEGIAGIFLKNLKLSGQGGPLAIAHLDEAFTDFMVIIQDKVIFIRNIPIGTQHLSEDREVNGAKFIEEIKKSQEAYVSADIDQSPSRLFLIGATDNFNYLVGVLKASLNMPVEDLSYPQLLVFSEGAAKVVSSNSRFSFLNAVACLFSIEQLRLDLVPDEIKLEKALKQRGRDIVKSGILVMSAFVLVYCILISKIYIKGSYLYRLSSRYSSIHKEAKQLEVDFTRNQVIRNFLQARGFSLEVLGEFYNLLPLDVQVNYLKFDSKGTFSIEGTGESMAVVFSFVDSLTDSPYFKKVETRYTRKRKSGKEDVADFALTCTLRDI